MARRSIHVLVVASWCVGASSCSGNKHRDGVHPFGNPPSSGVTAFFAARFGAAADTTSAIAGFNDDQRLPGDGLANYGPEARLYASPRLNALTGPDFQADTGAFVALLEVDGAVSAGMPNTYMRLKIKNLSTTSLYCVFLNHDTSNPNNVSWNGFVTPVTGTGICTTPAASMKLAADSDAANNAFSAADYPAVVRFSETNAHQPALGVKCLNAWCEIGHGAGVGKPPSQPQNGAREPRIKGWHDEQYLAVPIGSSGGGGGMQRSTNGTVTPVANLAGIKIPAYSAGWTQVATVWLEADPPGGTKYATWGLHAGDNPVELRLVGSGWRARFPTSPGNNVFKVSRTPHATTVPGVARWIWSDTDEDIWVACDQGCCEVTSIL